MDRSTFSRRHFVRCAIAGGATLLVPTVLDQRSAEAGRSWCRKDPDVLLEGTFVRVEMAIPEEFLPLVKRPTWLRFNVPAGVDREFVWADDGFNGLGYDITYTNAYLPNKPVGEFPVSLTIGVPISDGTKVPMWCCASPANGTYVEGTGNNANAGTVLNFRMTGTP